MGFAPAGWTELRNGIASWIRAASSSAGASWGWANDSKRPKMDDPYVLVEIMNPPRHTFHSGKKLRRDVVLIAAAAEQTYSINLESGVISYDAQLGDTVTIIRDALRAQIPGAADLGSDMLVLPEGETLPLSQPVSPEPDVLPKILNRRETRGECTIQVDSYGATDDDAYSLSLQIEGSIENESNRETLNTAGWGYVRIANHRSLPYFESGQWRGRAAFDLIMSCRYEIDEVIDYIESATVRTLDPSGGALSGEVYE